MCVCVCVCHFPAMLRLLLVKKWSCARQQLAFAEMCRQMHLIFTHALSYHVVVRQSQPRRTWVLILRCWLCHLTTTCRPVWWQ